MSLRVGVLVFLALCAAFAVGLIFKAGGDVERAKVATRDAIDTTTAVQANAGAARGAAIASDQHARIANTLAGAAADGRNELQHHTAPPAPNTVAGDAHIDPAFARLVLCRVERLRLVPHDADAAVCAAAPV